MYKDLEESRQDSDHSDEEQALFRRTSTIGALLNTGLAVSEYLTSTPGPLIYDNPGFDWSTLVALLDNFTSDQQIQHPSSYGRDPLTYQYPLCALNQELYDHHIRLINTQIDAESSESE